MTVFNWAITRKGGDELDPAQYWCANGDWVTDPLQAYQETTRHAAEAYYRANVGVLKGVVAVKVYPPKPGDPDYVPVLVDAELIEIPVPADVVELDVALAGAVPFSNDDDLDTLAAAANGWHAKAQGHAQSAVECAYMAGGALQAAKDQLGHGEFKAWVAANFTGTHRTANRYMRLASKWTRVSTLDDHDFDAVPSVNAALRAITQAENPGMEPNPKPEPTTPKLTKARRSHAVRELDRIRDFLVAARDDEYSDVELELILDREVPEWATLLREVADIIDAAEVK